MARETQLFLQAHVAIYTSEREAHASGRTETAVGIKSGGSWNTPEIKHPLFLGVWCIFFGGGGIIIWILKKLILQGAPNPPARSKHFVILKK